MASPSRSVTGVVAACVSAAVLVAPACSVLEVEEGGFNLMSIEDEWAMREDFKRQVAKEYRLVTDSQALSYVNGLGDRLVRQTPMANLAWDFGIVDDPGINAFNLPGGLVYVNKGLIEAADSLDELTAVLGHEIAHGTSRHGTQLMTRQYGLSVLAGVLLGSDASQREEMIASLVGSGILSRYGRDAEREADRLGIGYSHAAGYDPEGAVRMFQTLLELRQRRPSAVEQWFSSHPLTEERVAEARAIAAQLPRGNLTQDTTEYQGFRRRLGVAR